MAKRSFFSDLRYIASAIQRQQVSERGCEVFEELAAFVEACPFSKSRHLKFLCEHWRLDYDGLNRAWQSRGFEKKNPATFRVQASSVSRQLYALFPAFCRELFVSETDSREAEAGYRKIEDSLKILFDAARIPEELFLFEVLDYPGNFCPAGSLHARDCLQTAEKLKPLLKSEVRGYLDGLDKNQIKYILHILQKPLFGAKVADCNTEKLELLKALQASGASLQDGQEKGAVDRKDVADRKNAVDQKEAANRKETVERERATFEASEKIPYHLQLSKPLSDMLAHRETARLTTEASVRWTRMSVAEQDAEKHKIAQLLLLFTEAGFQKLLGRFHPLALQEVLDGDYPTAAGEMPYCFRK